MSRMLSEATGEQVALEPALAAVLAQDLHHPAVGRHVIVVGLAREHRAAVLHVEDVTEPVGVGLVRAEEPEVGLGAIAREDVAHELPELAGRAVQLGGRARDRQRVVGIVGQVERPEHAAAVGVRIRAEPAVAAGRERGQLGAQPAPVVEQLLRSIVPHPAVEHRQVGGIFPHAVHRHLVRAEGALDRQAVHRPGPGPALGRAEHDRGPPRSRKARGVDAGTSGLRLDGPDPGVAIVEDLGEARVHHQRVLAFHEMRVPAVAAQQAHDVVVVQAAEHGRPTDLVAVQVEDRQHRPVTGRAQEVDAGPAPGQRASLRLPVAHHRGHDQLRVVERGAEGVDEHVAQLAALVDRARSRHAHVARDAAGRRELAEEPGQPGRVLRHVGVDLGVGALEVHVGHDRGPTVPGPGQVDHVRVGLAHQTVEVRVDERQARRGAPVAEQPGLDVRGRERLPQQRVVAEIDLADGQVVRGPPVRVEESDLLGRHRHALISRCPGLRRRRRRRAPAAWTGRSRRGRRCARR